MTLHEMLFASKISGRSTGNSDLSDYYTKSQTNSLIAGKVDKVAGKSLSTNDFTDEYKAKIDGTDQQITDKIAEIIANAPADFDTLKEISDWIESHEDSASAMNTAINNKVDKVTGKGLSTNDFTTTLKNKLDGLSNYDDTKIKADISENTTAINSKVDKVTGKGLSTNDFTTTLKNKLNSLSNYDDTSIKADISALMSQTALNRSTLNYTRKNLLKNSDFMTSSSNGVTITDNSDGTYSLSGNPTDTATYFYTSSTRYSNMYGMERGKTYIISSGNSKIWIRIDYSKDGSTWHEPIIQNVSESATFTIPEDATGLYIRFRSLTSAGDLNGVILKPMVRYAGIADDTYEPYKPSIEERLTVLETAILALNLISEKENEA